MHARSPGIVTQWRKLLDMFKLSTLKQRALDTCTLNQHAVSAGWCHTCVRQVNQLHVLLSCEMTIVHCCCVGAPAEAAAARARKTASQS